MKTNNNNKVIVDNNINKKKFVGYVIGFLLND